MKFCEAVCYSFDIPVRLKKQILNARVAGEVQALITMMSYLQEL
jgi:hypothetical protein